MRNRFYLLSGVEELQTGMGGVGGGNLPTFPSVPPRVLAHCRGEHDLYQEIYGCHHLTQEIKLSMGNLTALPGGMQYQIHLRSVPAKNM